MPVEFIIMKMRTASTKESRAQFSSKDVPKSDSRQLMAANSDRHAHREAATHDNDNDNDKHNKTRKFKRRKAKTNMACKRVRSSVRFSKTNHI